MSLKDIAELRLRSQGIGESGFDSPAALLRHMGAMQAQDVLMAQWAIGMRVTGATEKSVHAAADGGEILRTHVMRPTWHFVPAEDIRWMLDLTAPRIRMALSTRHKFLGVTAALLKKTNRIIEKEIIAHGPVTRGELGEAFRRAGIRTDENRLSHLLICAELDQLVCSGSARGPKQTFDLLEKRVPEAIRLSREESLAELARRYFTSHGPATARDFSWWSGLNLTDCRNATEMIRSGFECDDSGAEPFWFKPGEKDAARDKPDVHLLPGYDEFLLGYADRSAVLPAEHNRKAVSNNGIFWPVIVVNGVVAGTWRKVEEKAGPRVLCSFFGKTGKGTRDELKRRVGEYAGFLGKRLGIQFSSKLKAQSYSSKVKTE